MLLFLRIREFEFRPRWLARTTNALLVGKIHSEEKHPISRPLMKLYHPVVRAALKLRWVVIILAIAIVVITIPVYQRLGSEFMPPLNEGSILYMPITLPGIGVTEAGKYLQIQDKLLGTVQIRGRRSSGHNAGTLGKDETGSMIHECSTCLIRALGNRSQPGWPSAVSRAGALRKFANGSSKVGPKAFQR